MFGRKILYQQTSPYGELLVYKDRNGTHLINNGKFCQTTYNPHQKPQGSVWDCYLLAPLFAKNPMDVKSICILGLGGGAAVKRFNQAYTLQKIVGVEINKDVVEVGEKYFDLTDQNLEVVIKDAAEYVKETEHTFDVVLVDTFHGDNVDLKCNSEDFYRDVLRMINLGGVVLANRVPAQNQKEANDMFLNVFPNLFPQCYRLKVKHNEFYFGLTKPLSKDEVQKRISSAAQENPNLGFLKRCFEFLNNRHALRVSAV